MTTTNLSKYTWIALLVGAFLVTCTPKAVAEETTTTNDWQGQLANLSIGADGTDIGFSVSNNDTTYTVKTALGLAWIAYVTNEKLTKPETSSSTPQPTDGTTDTNAQYYPSAAGFEGCTITLAPTTSPSLPATTSASYSSLRNTSGEANTLDLSAHLWVPIGNTNSKPFNGTFDGNHKMITGLMVKVENKQTGSGTGTSAYAGFFGKLGNNSKVSNLGIQVEAAQNTTQETENTPIGEIEATSTSGNSYAGALAGYNEQGTIENCFVSGTGTICSKSTSSSGNASSGGLVGYNGGTITHCYTTVKVVANGPSSSKAGGINGYCFGQYFQIKNVYATGKVEARGTSNRNYAGGIVGYCENGTLSNALALNKDGITGRINDNNSCGVGRITGFIHKSNESNLNACYASTKIRMNEKVKGKSQYYSRNTLSDDYHFNDGLSADTDTELSTLFPTGTGAAWATGGDGKLPILAGFDNITQPALPIADYLNEPLDLKPATQAQYSNTDGDSYTLTYSDTEGWTYKKGTANGDATSFSGRVKSTTEATADLTVTNTNGTTDDEVTLSFANNTSWTAGSGKTALTISSGSKPVALFSEGTVTIKGNSSGNFNYSLSVDNGVTCRFAPDNHFHLYGGIATNTSGTLLGLMGWQWNNAPTSDIEVFWTDGSTKIPVASPSNPYAKFATNPGGNDITVKVGDNYQKGKKNGSGSAVSPFNFDDNTNNAYVYYNEMGTGGDKGTEGNPYTVNLANPSADSNNSYSYSSNTITLTSPGSYYSLQGEVATGSTLTLTLSATADNASTTAYHLLAASGSKADILQIPSGTLCTIEGTNTLTATAVQVEGNLTLNAPVTLEKTMTSTGECLNIYNNGSVTVNSTLRVTATSSSGGFATAIHIGNNDSDTGTLTIGTDGQVYAYGTQNSCYLDEDAQLIVNGNGILRLAGSFVNNDNKRHTPIISWVFGEANNSPITVKDAADEVYATFSAVEFGEDNFAAAQSFATNVKLNADYTLYQTVDGTEKQLSGAWDGDKKETQTFRTETEFDLYLNVGIPLKVTDNSAITLTDYNKYQKNDGTEQDFSGILSNCELTSLTVNPTDRVINLIVTENTIIGTLTVKEEKGTTWYPNNTTVTTILVESKGSLTISDIAGTLTVSSTITNNGRFEDGSGQITQVEGDASLSLSSTSKRDGQTLTLNATIEAPTDATVKIQWQKLGADNSWTNISSPITLQSLQLRSSTETKTVTTTVTEEGSYRCWVYCTKKVDGNAVTTILTTKPANLITSGGDDDDDTSGDDDSSDTTPPVLYTVTLPAVEGAATDPAAGSYEVEAWDSFRFYLTLDAAYDQSTPVVSTSNGETLEPRSSDGAYIVKYVRNDTDIRIDGIVKNTPDVGNEAIASDGVKVWATAAQLHIHTIAPTDIYIYNFAGGLLKQFARLSGDKTVALPQGNYIVVAGKQMFKVQVK